MHTCPNCRKPTIPLRVALRFLITTQCSNCGATLRRRRQLLNAVPVVVLVLTFKCLNRLEPDLVGELLALGISTAAAVFVGALVTRFEVVSRAPPP